MGRSGGQGKGKPKLKDRNLGKALIKKLQKGTEQNNQANLHSILDNSALEDYIISAEMDEADVEVVRVHNTHAYLSEPTSKVFQSMNLLQFNFHQLQIPRKPSWNRQMSAEDVDRREKSAFLDWRRKLALLENSDETRKITPYEKNLDVWRQLWRVLERSDIAVQVVDARNPLLYYTQDIQNYAAEMNPPKPIILIVNKADFLSSYQRKIWADYFISHNIYVVYYSAFFEQERIDAIQKSHEPNPTSVNHDYINDEDLIILIENISDSWLSTSSKDMKSIDVLSSEAECTSDFDEVLDDDNQSGIYSVSDYSEDIEENSSDVSSDIHSLHSLSEDVDPVSTNERKITEINAKPKSELHEKFIRITSKLLNREQLISFLSILPEKFGISPQDKHKGKVCIGMVGYPNVGKSSVINTILGVSKSTHGVVRVGVSSTPGKTKHFQTLIVNDDLMLCDCPGLVFPSFMSSTGEMICAGILPINQMRDHMEPASIISSRVPEDILNALYGMKIKRVLDFKDAPERPPTAVEFLSAYCEVKKYITETNRFDEFRGCKEILRDFTNGRILSVCPPPDVDFDINRWLRESESIMMKNERVAERLALIRLKQLECNDIENVESISNKPIENESDLVFDGENFNNYDDESDEEDVNVKAESNQSVEKREHKKLKHWGKKNKKLRNKNPYNEENGLVSFVAYSTNRTCYSSEKSISDHDKIKRHDPRKSYGKPFVRPTFPHINSLDVN